MKTAREKKFVMYSGTAALAMIAMAVSFVILRVQATEEIVGLKISPESPLTVEAGGTVRLTAEGDYGTRTMPMSASWSITQGTSIGALKNCDASKTCTFVAGPKPGAVMEASAASSAPEPPSRS